MMQITFSTALDRISPSFPHIAEATPLGIKERAAAMMLLAAKGVLPTIDEILQFRQSVEQEFIFSEQRKTVKSEKGKELEKEKIEEKLSKDVDDNNDEEDDDDENESQEEDAELCQQCKKSKNTIAVCGRGCHLCKECLSNALSDFMARSFKKFFCPVCTDCGRDEKITENSFNGFLSPNFLGCWEKYKSKCNARKK